MKVLVEKLEYLLPIVFRRLEQVSSEDENSLSLVQRMVLFILMKNGHSTMTEISNGLGITKGGSTTLIDRLTAEGLVTRKRDDDDRRIVYVEITGKGRRLLKISKHRRLKSLEHYLAQLAPEDVAALTNIFEKLAGIISDEPQQNVPAVKKEDDQ